MLAALTAAICYYVAFALTVLIGARWGDPSANLVTSFAVSVGSVIAIALAVSAYLSHRAIRHIYLLINILAGLGGILITGWHLARGAQPQWLALDIAGVGAALFVIWVFYYSRSARTFLEDREYFVKRD